MNSNVSWKEFVHDAEPMSHYSRYNHMNNSPIENITSILACICWNSVFWQLARSTLPVPKQRWKWACIQPFWTQLNFNLPTLILNYWNNCIHETNLHNQTETINSANCIFQVQVKERNAMIKERQVTIQRKGGLLLSGWALTWEL